MPKAIVTASVTASKTQVPTNAHTEVISAKAIKKTAAVNLIQVLQGVVGINLNDLTGTDNKVSLSMRGFGGNAAQNSLVLLNGIPLIMPDLASVNLSLIPLNVIKKIEVFNGSQSVLFGSQAVGGAVNIVTKKPEKDSLYGEMSVGSFNKTIYQEGFSLIGKHGIYTDINLRKLKTSNYREHNGDNNVQAFGNIGEKSQKSGFNIFYNLYQQYLQYAGALTQSQVAQNRRQAQNNLNFANDNAHYIQLKQYHFLTPNWQENFSASTYQLKGTGFLFDPFALQQNSNWLQLETKGLIKSTLLTSGVVYSNGRYELQNGSYKIFSKENRFALFSLSDTTFAKHYHFFAGLRSAWQHSDVTSVSQISDNPSAFVTELGLTYQLNKKLNLFIRRAGNYRFPKVDENAQTTTGTGGLKTQKGVDYSIGTNFDWLSAQGTFSLFDLDLHNEIAFDPTSTAANPFGTNRNLPPTRRLGLLLNIKRNITHNITLGGQYSFVKPTFSKGIYAGNTIPFVAENTTSVYMNDNFYQNFNLYTQLVYTGSRFYEGDDANAFSKEPAFFIFNTALSYQGKIFFMNFRVNNIFNKDYNAFGSVNTVSVMPLTKEAFFYPAPGRNYLFTFGFRLS